MASTVFGRKVRMAQRERELDEALKKRKIAAQERLMKEIGETDIHKTMCERIKAGPKRIYFSTSGNKNKKEMMALVRSSIAEQGMTHRYRVTQTRWGDIEVSLRKKKGDRPRVCRLDSIEEQLKRHENALSALTHHPLVGTEMKLAAERFEEWKSRHDPRPAGE